jgi:sugar/nucleoside kinase (ribokinase family)
MHMAADNVRVITCGFVVVDIIASVIPKLPEPGGLIYPTNGVIFHIGGHPANISVDLVQLGMESNEVGCIGAVGKDFLGEFIKSFLRSRGVRFFLQEVDDARTGKTIVLVVKGKDRSFIGDPGANLRLDYKKVMKEIEERQPSIFYLACGMLGDFDYKVPQVLELCQSKNILTILDFIKPYGKGWDFILPALDKVDVLHCNNLELAGVSGTRNIKKGIKILLEHGVKVPIVTFGEKGALCYFQKKYIRVPAFKVRVVDTTGAGDAFCAGLIKKIYEKTRDRHCFYNFSLNDMIDTLIYASAAGASCVEGIGTTTAVTKENVSRLISNQKEHVMKNIIVREDPLSR